MFHILLFCLLFFQLLPFPLSPCSPPLLMRRTSDISAALTYIKGGVEAACVPNYTAMVVA